MGMLNVRSLRRILKQRVIREHSHTNQKGLISYFQMMSIMINFPRLQEKFIGYIIQGPKLYAGISLTTHPNKASINYLVLQYNTFMTNCICSVSCSHLTPYVCIVYYYTLITTVGAKESIL